LILYDKTNQVLKIKEMNDCCLSRVFVKIFKFVNLLIVINSLTR